MLLKSPLSIWCLEVVSLMLLTGSLLVLLDQVVLLVSLVCQEMIHHLVVMIMIHLLCMICIEFGVGLSLLALEAVTPFFVAIILHIGVVVNFGGRWVLVDMANWKLTRIQCWRWRNHIPRQNIIV